MAQTLVITGANFASNKLDTVTLTTPIACKSISFSAAAADVTYNSTYTITYTVTPANTTEAIVWTSNNANFTVSNGVVTIGGVGQGTITATCGSRSASITLTSTATFDSNDFDAANGMGMDFTSDYGTLFKGSDRLTLGLVSDTGYHSLWSDTDTQAVGLTFCPAAIPPGSTSMKINYSASYATKVGFADTNTQSSIGYGAVKIVSHDSAGTSAASRTLTIPNDATGFYVAIYGINLALLEIQFT